MTRYILSAIVALLIGAAIHPAWAACKGELEWAERRVGEIRDDDYRRMAATQLRSAQSSLAQGNEMQCLASVSEVTRFARWDAISRPGR